MVSDVEEKVVKVRKVTYFDWNCPSCNLGHHEFRFTGDCPDEVLCKFCGLRFRVAD